MLATDSDPRRVFGTIADRLGFRLHWADVRAMAALADRLAPLALTPARATALVFVARHEGCDQVALGGALAINRASTMKLVDALVAIGAVERRAGRDRRSNALHLTAAGAALVRTVERVLRDHDADQFAALSAAERATLHALLVRIAAPLNAEEPPCAVSMN